MIELLEFIDTQFFLYLNGPNSIFFDVFMKLYSERFIWIPFYIALMLMIWRTKGTQKCIYYTIGIALAILLTDQLCATVIRPIVERLRPSNLKNAISALTYTVDGYRGGAYGFPSCHAANSFALATFMSLLIHRRLFIFIIITWALMNSYSRIYLGVHYPGDILVGALIGSTIGTLCFLATRRFIDRKQNNKADNRHGERPLWSWNAKSKKQTILYISHIHITALHTAIAAILIVILYIILRATIA